MTSSSSSATSIGGGQRSSRSIRGTTIGPTSSNISTTTMYCLVLELDRSAYTPAESTEAGLRCQDLDKTTPGFRPGMAESLPDGKPLQGQDQRVHGEAQHRAQQEAGCSHGRDFRGPNTSESNSQRSRSGRFRLGRTNGLLRSNRARSV